MGDECTHNGERLISILRTVCVKCGHTRCPECRRFYDPVLGVKDNRGVKRAVGLVSIQNEFPGVPGIQREQLKTGICSDPCWNKIMDAVDELEDPSDNDLDPLEPGE